MKLGMPQRHDQRRSTQNDRYALAAACCLAAAVATGCSSHHQAALDAGYIPVDGGHPAVGHVDVLTQHNDAWRTGQNVNETVLTTSNVSAATFGELFSMSVDGLVYAQPLIITYTEVNGAMHDVVLVATMHNSVYAFDANTGAQLWETNLGPSVPASDIGQFLQGDAGEHIGTVNTLIEVGILSTPVVDRVNGYIYLARADYTNQTMSVKMHVLSLATGEDESGSPVTVTGQAEGASGTIAFDATHESQRPGLLLLNGTVYVAFASYQDWPPFYGWIFGYTYSGGALSQTQTFISTPGSEGGGFWNSGQGLLSDGTSIYALSSNAQEGSTPLSSPPSYGEAFLKLSAGLDVEDWFVPYNYNYLNESDGDLGAGGPLLIPGTRPLLISGGGKGGMLYTLDTTNMGHLGTTDDMGTQAFQAVTDSIYGAPVLWTGDGAPKLFIWGTGDVLKEYVLDNGLFNTTPIATSAGNATLSVPLQDPCGILSVSSNDSQPGTGIVWATKPLANPDHNTVPGMFYAFNADTLAQLWSTPVRDYAKFVPPTIANGKVYLATHAAVSGQPSSVIVYGLLTGGK